MKVMEYTFDNRCSDCKYVKDGKCTHPHSMYCQHCELWAPKERGAGKPKITCLNCKHLMFSDMYGECNKQLRIVNPSDTCEFAELKERGGGK